MKEVSLSKGEFIIKENDKFDKCFIITSGVVVVKKFLDTER